MKRVDFTMTITGSVDVEDYMPKPIGRQDAKDEAVERLSKWVGNRPEIDITGPTGSFECTLHNLGISGDIEAVVV